MSAGQTSGPTGPVIITIFLFSLALFVVVVLFIFQKKPPRVRESLTEDPLQVGQDDSRSCASRILESIPMVAYGASTARYEMTGEISADRKLEVDGKKATDSPNSHQRIAAHPGIAAVGPDALQPVVSAEGHEIESTGGGPSASSGQSLSCCICTDEFMEGQGVRVLPCDHMYHAACIDDWILNFAETCPLWIDLRARILHNEGPPYPTVDDATEGTLFPSLAPNETTSAPPQVPHIYRRLSHSIDLSLLAHRRPEEQIAALHRIRAQNREGHRETARASSRDRLARIARAILGSRSMGTESSQQLDLARSAGQVEMRNSINAGGLTEPPRVASVPR